MAPCTRSMFKLFPACCHCVSLCRVGAGCGSAVVVVSGCRLSRNWIRLVCETRMKLCSCGLSRAMMTRMTAITSTASAPVPYALRRPRNPLANPVSASPGQGENTEKPENHAGEAILSGSKALGVHVNDLIQCLKHQTVKHRRRSACDVPGGCRPQDSLQPHGALYSLRDDLFSQYPRVQILPSKACSSRRGVSCSKPLRKKAVPMALASRTMSA